MKQGIKQKIKTEYGISEDNNIYTLLLDMNSIMKMSISADKRINGKGEEYGMIVQTLIQIKKMLIKKNFDYVYALYDGYNSGVLRYEIYHDYKANRGKQYEFASARSDYEQALNDYVKKVMNYSKQKNNKKDSDNEDENFQRQREIIFKILEEVFVRQVICENVEGDDLIAYYVNNKQPNEKIIIYSGDCDLSQLLSDDVALYMPQLKKFLTKENHIEIMGYPSENVLLKKILCGDSSDNIKGIKGLGEVGLFKYFPRIQKEKVTLQEIIAESKLINEERIKQKKKPLAALNNIIESKTDGIQGNKIYEINELIISLQKPLLTPEAIEEFDAIRYAPLDPDGRDFKNIYKIIQENDITDLMDEKHFSSFFSIFNNICNKEIKRFKNNL